MRDVTIKPSRICDKPISRSELERVAHAIRYYILRLVVSGYGKEPIGADPCSTSETDFI